MSDIYQQLSEAFPKEVERTLSKSGTRLTYIPVSEVITRLNRVLGVGSWNYRIIKCERDSLDPDFVVAHVTLEAHIKDHNSEYQQFVQRDGFGGQKIKRTKNGDIVDLGDEMKGAVSDALKKAAQTLGIGLYLARTEEAIEAEEVREQETKIDPEIEQLWTNFVGLSKELDKDGKANLNEFWKTFAGDRPKPTKTTATVGDLKALIAECLRISLGGIVVTDE